MAALLFGLLTAGPSRQRSSHWSSSHRGASHRRCDVNKGQGRFGKKNDRLIGKKPPNPVGTEEENQGRKDLVVVQSSKINLRGQSSQISLLLLSSCMENSRSLE